MSPVFSYALSTTKDDFMYAPYIFDHLPLRLSMIGQPGDKGNPFELSLRSPSLPKSHQAIAKPQGYMTANEYSDIITRRLGSPP